MESEFSIEQYLDVARCSWENSNHEWATLW